VEHRGFCEEPPRQAWPPAPKSSVWVDNFWCVSVHPISPATHHANVIIVYTGLSLLFPLFSSFFFTAPRTAEGRLLTYFLTFCPCFVILSISAEGLFYVSYCATLYLWILVEEDARREKARYRTTTTTNDDSKYGLGWNPRRLSLDDARIALFFLFFVQVGFFGTGK
jgi:GPI ethanolamine phosphate transferase 1